MSKVFQALQKAHGEKLRSVPRPEPTPIGLPSAPKPSPLSSVATLQVESEMLGLAQNIQSRLPEDKKYVIQFIGSRKGEGTSTLIREFGCVLADKASKFVLLVETDLENLNQHQVFGLEPKLGLDQIINENKSLDKGISQVGNSTLFLSTFWPKPFINPSAIVSLNPEDLWARARQTFDFILVDSASINSNTEALALSARVDGVVLVIEAEKTRSHITQNTRDRIFQAGGNLLGIVFNKQRFYIPQCIYKYL